MSEKGEASAAPAEAEAITARLAAFLASPPVGWLLANPEHVPAFAAAVAAGASVAIDDVAVWLADAGIARDDDAPLAIVVSDQRVAGRPDRLVFHPQSLSLGLSCAGGGDPEAAVAVVLACLGESRFAPGAVAAVGSADDPESAKAAAAVARWLETGPPKRAPGNAGDVALSAAGTGAALAQPPIGAHGIACAIARAPLPHSA